MSHSKFQAWIQAIRVFSLTASTVPVLIGGSAALGFHGTKTWWNLPLFLVSAVLFHAATNLINDYYDFLKGVDKQGSLGSSGVLVAGLLTPRQVLRGAWILLGAGFAIGSVLILTRGLPILILGMTGILGGYFYTASPIGYKYMALGDVFVFLLMGVLLVVGAYFVVTGSVNALIIFISLPISFLVTAILNANNLRDIHYDIQAGVKTFAGLVGHGWAKVEYYCLIGFAYLSVAIMVLGAWISPWCFMVFMTLPLAWNNVRQIQKSHARRPQDIAFLDVATAKLHFLFGFLMALALVLGNLWPAR